ncbi:MAG: phage tail assembly chaperone [Rhizobiales bacterium]|nr:phage tail assembly chaperone [Hyphomicrobiales bacterium]
MRADLRALATIASKYHDFADLYGRIAAFDWTATLDLIAATCTDPDSILFPADPDWVQPESLDEFFTLVTPQLLGFIERIAGADNTNSTEPSDPITLTELIERLFKVGSGWLEWSPEDTWNATPAEILLARDGLIEKLKAIHGSADADKNNGGKSTDWGKGLKSADRNRLNALGDYGVKTMAEVPA